MPSNDKPIELGGSVWLTVGGENLGGPGRMALLAQIAECGSITHAAKAIKMSYKAAWDAIDTMNNLAGEPLVARVAGGKGGGCTVLTRRGTQLVENFRLIEREHQRFVTQLGAQAQNMADDLLLIRSISMKTSARNHFVGPVSRVQPGAVNDEIEIQIAGGHPIVAIVTHASAQDLGLEVGAQAFALVKASSIVVVTQAQGAKFSARNRLTGTVARLVPGAVNTEVVIDLPGGGSVAAIITHESCSALALTEGAPATAIFKASSVIVGTPA
ncbi:MAG: TOBE domain-containing protein [Simplicispira sp.]|nr:TOBE domain-containing protein [Simplicispira sp.]